MLLGFTYASTLIVLGALIWIVVARPWMIVRPSVMFLGLFWLQVQFSAAANAHLVYPGLDRSWALFAVLHAFPVAVLAGVLLTFRKASRRVADRIGEASDKTALRTYIAPLVALTLIVAAVTAFYLSRVPFTQTGLYALLFEPAKLDVYREQSMKLLDSVAVAYSFAIMEKVVAPLGAAFAAAAGVKAWRSARYALVPVFAVWAIVIGLPTLLYGARGPLTMVVLAAIVTVVVLHIGRLRLHHYAIALLLCLVPIALVSTLRSDELTFRALAYHTANIFDRAIGRGYIDNAWHLAHVERNGYHGIAGIEKLAPLFGVEPKDFLNVVGKEYSGADASTGLAIFGVSAPPEPCQIRLTCDGPDRPKLEGLDITQTASAGASFQTLNFAMFGWWSLPFSVAFVIALDLLLFVYLRMPAEAAAPVVGAMSVPVLGLCFSMMTTVLASKGLLLIPAVGWLVGSFDQRAFR